MTKREKRLQKIRQNPRNVSYEDLRQVLEDYGFFLARSSGSHHNFVAEIMEREWKLTIPYHRPHIKRPYVEAAIKAIDEIIRLKFESQESENLDDNDN